ncbi:hypothetical protein KAS10_01005, partial [Candidatus Aerophobetes bacterium]|nr:hypothetical protein [Candidatus Aerophobetes bacterium]
MKKEVGIGIMLYLLAFASLARGEISPDLVDIPTPRILGRYQTQVTFRFYREGGLLLKGRVGLTERLSMGLSYGARGVV